MSAFRFRYEELGGHTHVRVFAGSDLKSTLGKCGDLIFTNEEWQAFRNKLPTSASVAYVEEDSMQPGDQS